MHSTFYMGLVKTIGGAKRIRRWMLVLAGLALFAGTSFHCLQSRPSVHEKTTPTFNHAKTVLLYTPYFKNADWELGALGSAPFQHCPVTNCHVTNIPTELPSVAEFDAVLFHLKDIVDFPAERSPEQRYVVFTKESPDNHVGSLEGFRAVFNWTMTYRRDSDIWTPYGRVVPRRSGEATGFTMRAFEESFEKRVAIQYFKNLGPKLRPFLGPLF